MEKNAQNMGVRTRPCDVDIAMRLVDKMSDTLLEVGVHCVLHTLAPRCKRVARRRQNAPLSGGHVERPLAMKRGGETCENEEKTPSGGLGRK